MSTVSIVHCIDTEGPLNEPTEATFERIRFILNIKELDLEPTRINLEKNLSELLDLSRKLREANKDLRSKNSKLNMENKNLKEKLELTKNKIENLIPKLEST